MTEQYGAVPLPPGEVRIVYEPNTIKNAQQPQAQQLAVFEAPPNDSCVNGTVIDVNQHFCVYAVKNGLIRVLHRHSTLRELLRAHEGKIVTDIRFFQSGDVLGTVGGNVVIWRVFERSPDIVAEKLLEIPESLPSVTRLIWHPFNPNQFWLFHKELQTQSTVATLVETTRITTVAAGAHAICQMYRDDVVMEGAVRVAGANVTDLCWSGKDSKHVLTGHDDGAIRFWDIKSVDPNARPAFGTVPAFCKCVLQENDVIARCLFLPHDDHINNHNNAADADEPALTTCFCTSAKYNASITIWSPFTVDGTPKRLHVFRIDNPSPAYNLNVCYGPISIGNELPPAFFFMLSDRKEGKMFCVSLKSSWSESDPKRPLVEGFDYVVPFQTKFPTYSWSVTCGPAENLEEGAPTGGLNFDIRFFALQSKMVQQMTLLHYMCLPPSGEWSEATTEVRIEEVIGAAEIDDEEQEFDEEYEIEDGGEFSNEDFEAPDASSLPQPLLGATGVPSDNPFGNWLGALAGKTDVVAPPTDPMPPPVPPSTPANVSATTPAPPGLLNAVQIPNIEQPAGGAPGFLSPMELLSATKDTAGTKPKELPLPVEKKRTKSPKNNNDKRGNSPKRKGKKSPMPIPSADGKIAILKRETQAPIETPEPASSSTKEAGSVNSTASEESLKKALAAHLKAQDKQLVQEIQRTVRTEMQTSVIPDLGETLTRTMKQAVSNAVQKSVDEAMSKRSKLAADEILAVVSTSVEAPVREAFAESMRNALIPAFESATKQILTQVATSLEEQEQIASKSIADLTDKVNNLTQLVQSLHDQIGVMNGLGAAQRGDLPPQDEKQKTRDEILELLGAYKFEEAFTMALSASTAEMAVFACKNADIRRAFDGDTPALSQPILLCLMQQLGAVLLTATNTDLDIVLTWLQEIALTLDPRDFHIHRHVPGVLQQLEMGINARMKKSTPEYRRPLQMLLQVIRGTQR